MLHPNSSAAPTREPPFRYTAALAHGIETGWQRRWDELETFVTPNPGASSFDASKPRFYCLDMFPYPSGAGLHVGHPEGYTATDIVCRYKRMKGFNVLHPMGWDAFGLPAEQYAIQTGIHPAVTTREAIDNFRRQLKRFGFSYDWSRELGTIDPGYYKWTQWIFLRLYNAWFDESAPGGGKARPIGELVEMLERGKLSLNLFGELVASPANASVITGEPVGLRRWHELSPAEQREFLDSRRLAYQSETMVNWCPKLGTVLANDEVIDGRSERGSHPVVRRPLKQWMFRITDYAGRLLSQLEGLDWPESTKTMQREWIGRSEGAEIEFPLAMESSQVYVEGSSLEVFTTRPDTIFGATYMVVAPEHELVSGILAAADAGDPAVMEPLRRYVAAARGRSDIERQESKEKTGVFTGVYAVNPATGGRIPVWTAEYVLMGYGTGAIMAVPAHDERDYAFAKAHDLPIRIVVDQLLDTPAAVKHVLSQHFATGHFAAAVWVRPMGPDGQIPLEQLMARLPITRPGLVVEAGQGDWGRILLVHEEVGDAVIAGIDAPCIQYDLSSAQSEEGHALNSSNAEISLDGLPTSEAKARITEWLAQKGIGRRRVNYRLRDWTFSRQRYWGEPFPIVYTADGTPYPVSEAALPVMLPELADYAPVESNDPQPLLAKATAWVNTTAGKAGVDPALLPPETPVRRETNTMPGSAGSSWYAVRYCDPGNTERFVSPGAEQYWMKGGVDLYLGGAEHAVGHLLYARFWHSVLHDLGHLSSPEPFRKLFHQGLITSFSYQRADKTLVPADQVDEVKEGEFVERGTGARLTPVVAKMSKSLKNVVNPDDVIAEFGADTFRLYEMYMGPLEASKPWNPRDITGLHRFLARLWRLCVDEQTGALRVAPAADVRLEKQLHRTVAKVGTDIERLAFNTAISAMIEFVNAAGAGPLERSQISRLALVVAPFAPHIAEELWSKLGHAGSLSHEAWPAVDPAMLKDDHVELAVQVLGKVRCKLTVPADAEPKTVEALALADSEVQKHLAGKPVKKLIVVPGRLINIVV